MARMRRKANLPVKVCPVCDRPFSWRRKWERVWDEVRYCSDRCRAAGRGERKPRSTVAGLDPAPAIREA